MFYTHSNRKVILGLLLQTGENTLLGGNENAFLVFVFQKPDGVGGMGEGRILRKEKSQKV